jgi:hypothetical protein
MKGAQRAGSCRLLAAALLTALGAAGTPAMAQLAPATTVTQATSTGQPFDSLLVRRLLLEAVAAAREASQPVQGALLVAVGRAQIEMRDFAGAERTLAMGAQGSPDRVSSAMGNPAWFGMLDRSGLARSLTCTLREEGQPEDALAVVRRMPPGAGREWELAHAAALTAGVSGWVPNPAAAGRGDLAQRRRDALAIARELSLPEARLDALVAIVRAALDSVPDVGLATQAYAEARQVRLVDADRQQQRNAMLASLAFLLGRHADGHALFSGLEHPQDIQYVVSVAATDSATHGVVGALAPGAVAAARRIVDPAARRVFESHLHAMLTRAGEQAIANGLLPAREQDDDSGAGWRATRDSTRAASDHPRDAAERALDSLAFAEVRRHVSRLPSRDPNAERAQLLSDLAWRAFGAYRDTARAYLRSAHGELLAAGADSAVFDARAQSIAYRQFWLAEHDAGLATLNLIRDPSVGASVAEHAVGASSFSKLGAADVRRLADGVRDPRVRDALLVRLATGYLLAQHASGEHVRWARALIDSIPSAQHRASVRLAVAANALQRRDSATARAEYRAVLDGAGSPRMLAGLIQAGGWQDLVQWSRAADVPAVRAQRLTVAATALHGQLMRMQGRSSGFVFWSGPHWCRDVF